MLKFVHVLIGVTMLGFVVAYYFYFNFNQKDLRTRRNILRLSFLMDGLILPFILILFMTGAQLMVANHLSPAVPWVHVAFMALGLVTFCWLISVCIKITNYYFLSRGKVEFYGKRIFHTCNILIIVLMVIIIHDAVTQSTFLGFMQR